MMMQLQLDIRESWGKKGQQKDQSQGDTIQRTPTP